MERCLNTARPRTTNSHRNPVSLHPAPSTQGGGLESFPLRRAICVLRASAVRRPWIALPSCPRVRSFETRLDRPTNSSLYIDCSAQNLLGLLASTRESTCLARLSRDSLEGRRFRPTLDRSGEGRTTAETRTRVQRQRRQGVRGPCAICCIVPAPLRGTLADL